MEQTWRWFGPDDPVSLADIKQTGATGIVTALHHIPHGEEWLVDEILKRKNIVEASGFRWSVVESITVHEDIKTRSGQYRSFIEKYKNSIRNVAKCGIPVITYNFMPVNDWTRTSLDYKMPDGSLALYFSWIDLAVFDVFILKRKAADTSYEPSILSKAQSRFKTKSAKELDLLANVIMFGIPGEKKSTVPEMLDRLKRYAGIDHAALQSNLGDFLEEITPVAAECGVRLALHPDDPPYPIFGLPRVVSSMADFNYILHRVNEPASGVCFCTGSLGASPQNDLPAMARQIGNRIHFAHLRNVKKDEEGNFYESDHLDGDVNMYAVMKELLLMQQETNRSIPFRPDHGHQVLDDIHKVTNPGYSAIGRLKGLAELRGLELGISSSMRESSQ